VTPTLTPELRQHLREQIDAKKRERIAGSQLTRQEIRRQHVENGLSAEQIADLTGYRPSDIRQSLRGLTGGYQLGALRPQDRGQGRRSLAIPAGMARKIEPGARFICELVGEGILYRRVA